MAILEQYQNSNSPLARLLAEAPYLSRCSDNKTAARIRPREYAVKYPYMQVNQKDLISWLVFDLDHPNANIWDDEGLPTPNLIVRNRRNGHSHLFYAINPVMTGETARTAPIRYMKAVYEAMALKLKADTAYSGPVAKTPGHSWWLTTEIHPEVYELGVLAESVTLTVNPFQNARSPNLDDISHSRHCLLFERVRHYAYSIVNGHRENGTYNSFLNAVDDYAFKSNRFTHEGFSMDLRVSQVRATVKSIANWTWDRYTGKGGDKNYGVMNLSPDLPIEEKQSLSAKRTHELRKNTSQARISAAYRLLSASKDKRPVTIQAIAKQSGLSRQTVAKYKHLLQPTETSKDTKVISLQEIFRGFKKDVNYGVHQITAAFIAGLSQGESKKFNSDGELVIFKNPEKIIRRLVFKNNYRKQSWSPP